MEIESYRSAAVTPAPPRISDVADRMPSLLPAGLSRRKMDGGGRPVSAASGTMKRAPLAEKKRGNDGPPLSRRPSLSLTPSPKDDVMARLAAEAKAKSHEWVARYAAKKAAREKGLPGEDSDEEYDDYAVEASKFRDTWNLYYSRYYGRFEDNTKIPNMRFTYKKPEGRSAIPCTTLQIFSLKVSMIRGGLQWPLQVFGMVAIRDCVDHNRNIIFDRPRDNCQILTQEVPYLKLTGPTRAVVLLDPATFEVDLKVKGSTELQDECLSFLAVKYINFERPDSHCLMRDFTTRLSTLEFELGSMVTSVEATIALRITKGLWPDGCRAQFTAGTTSISNAEVILLDSGKDKVYVLGYGRSIMLSRCVASVEDVGELKVCAKALQGDKVVVERQKVFMAKKDGVSDGTLHLGFCTLGVTISWSLISEFAPWMGQKRGNKLVQGICKSTRHLSSV